MFNFFNTKPLLTDDDAKWVINTFQWALTHFDQEEFFGRSVLVEPSDKFFPGQVDSHQAMASTVFQSTLKYSGLAHWPMQLVHPATFTSQPPAFLNLDLSKGIKRNSSTQPLLALASEQPLAITYNLHQTLKPEDLSASFAHYMSQHLVAQSQLEPIGGRQYFAQATEIIAVFMGFGLLMANSAYTFRGSCGRCYNADANRHATLSEDKVVFALALFCHLKGIETSQVTKYLKKYLRSLLKQAMKQLKQYPELIAAMQASQLQRLT